MIYPYIDTYLGNLAFAHSLPVTQFPAPDSIIKKGEPLPSKVIIDFSERPDPTVSTITILNEKNERVDNGDFTIIGDHSREAMITLNTKKLIDGVYTVSWMTQSADDGHIARGSYVFGIGDVGPNAQTSLIGKNTQQQVHAVTSYLDGLIKWPLIVSQATVVGIIFSHLFLWENFAKKIRIRMNKPEEINDTGNRSLSLSLPLIRRLVIILVAVSITIIASGTTLILLQITELSTDNTSGYWSIFISLLHGPSGISWLVRTMSSLIVIASAVTYYYLRKNMSKVDPQQEFRYKKSKILSLSSLMLLIALVAGSVSIFANSATSHNSGVSFVPSLAVSLDWLHFMSVSMWVGGLFYIATILLVAIRERAKLIADSDIREKITISNTTLYSEMKKSQVIHYYLALLLPRFSLIATVSLGVIGMTGIYMAWINLNNIDSLFTNSYGNILLIKLITALPLVLLGGYHQLKLHNAMVFVASIGKLRSFSSGNDSNSNLQVTHDLDYNKTSTDDHKDKSVQNVTDKPKNLAKNRDIASKFTKTIKIESLIAISVLLVASILTITSPSHMNMGSMSMTSSAISNTGMQDMSMQNLKNGSYIKETKIMNVNTKIEINPFHSGFNTFKVTFTDSNGKPYGNISTVRMIFKNDQADIGPITANLKSISTGVYAITGGYISQPGDWKISIAAQRPSNYDLNYRLNSKVNSTYHWPNAIW